MEYHASSNNALFHRAGRNKKEVRRAIQDHASNVLRTMPPKEYHSFIAYSVRDGVSKCWLNRAFSFALPPGEEKR